MELRVQYVVHLLEKSIKRLRAVVHNITIVMSIPVTQVVKQSLHRHRDSVYN